MKKSDLVIGNYYAYSTKREELPSWITKVKLVDLQSEKSYRSKSNTVGVEFTHTRGWGDNREEYKAIKYVQLYTLKGEYDTVANAIELRKRDLKIQSLEGQIEKNRRVGVQNRYKKAFIEFGISQYSFSDYRPSFSIDFTEAQFITVSRLLEAYNKDLADAKAKAEETVNA